VSALRRGAVRAADRRGVVAPHRGAVRPVVARDAMGAVLRGTALLRDAGPAGLRGGGSGAEQQRRAEGENGKHQADRAEHAVVFLGSARLVGWWPSLDLTMRAAASQRHGPALN
jgi:hypothetical protein